MVEEYPVVSQIITHVSEETDASIIRVVSTVMMKAVGFSTVLAMIYQTRRHHIPKDCTFHGCTNQHQNVNLYILVKLHGNKKFMRSYQLLC
jgi:hypothetical protein